MENQKVTVVARIKAKPGKEAQVKQVLSQLLSPTRLEAGCINYDMHESFDNPAHFLFHENWTNQEALNKHLETAHLKNFLNQADQLLDEPVEITLWKQAI
ncbi:MAG: putative quinol monooxygenase [Acidobacteriota bacterium]